MCALFLWPYLLTIFCYIYCKTIGYGEYFCKENKKSSSKIQTNQKKTAISKRILRSSKSNEHEGENEEVKDKNE